jgi:hypothetical protein
MKVIQNNLYDIWYKLTDKLLEAKENSREDFKEEGKRAWKVLMECADRIDVRPKAGAAFWAAWGSCNVTYKDLAELLIKEPDRWNWNRDRKPVTEDQIKWLLKDARDKIEKCALAEVDFMISRSKNE